ncbi:MAG: LysR family transcriptional regulator [Alphaproteobacteria bacterium]|nr:LysR family transcriptional regulator [Alphaproteobacteria bacterium]
MTRTPRKGDARRESGITLSALRTFVAVVDAGSFSRAAAALGVSQPSVSIQLNSLERACKVLLLHRRPRLELTDAGRDLLVRARLIISRLEEFEGSVSELRSLKRGRLIVGMSGPHVVMPLIASFVEAHPSIALETRIGNTSTLLDDVAQCRIDVGIVAMADASAGLACARIADLRLALCVRRDDPLARRKVVRAEQAGDLKFIMRERGSITRVVAERVFAAARVRPDTRFEVTGREAMKEAIVAGLGVGILFVHEADGDSRLATVEFADAAASAGIYAVAQRESLDIPAVGAFIDHLEAHGPLSRAQAVRRS